MPMLIRALRHVYAVRPRGRVHPTRVSQLHTHDVFRFSFEKGGQEYAALVEPYQESGSSLWVIEAEVKRNEQSLPGHS